MVIEENCDVNDKKAYKENSLNFICMIHHTSIWVGLIRLGLIRLGYYFVLISVANEW